LALLGVISLTFNPLTVLASGGHGQKGETGHNPHGDVTKKVVNAISEMHHHLEDGHIEWSHMKVELNKIKHEIEEIGEHAKIDLMGFIEKSLKKKDKESFAHNLLSVCYYMMVDKLHQTEDQIDDFKLAKENFQNAALAYKPISLILSKSDPNLDKNVKVAFRNAAKALGSPKKHGSARKSLFSQEKEKIEGYLHSYLLKKAGQGHGH
jgi:hypothetical protein